jgi:hypothetical protein
MLGSNPITAKLTAKVVQAENSRLYNRQPSKKEVFSMADQVVITLNSCLYPNTASAASSSDIKERSSGRSPAASVLVTLGVEETMVKKILCKSYWLLNLFS